MHIQIHAIAAQQFQAGIGTQVRMDPGAFVDEVLEPEITNFEETLELADALDENLTRMKASGQYRIEIKKPLASTIFRCGVGRHTHNPKHYVVREWRGHAQLFLRREHAAPVRSASVIVYTRAALLADPDTNEETRSWLEPETTHVLVTCLAAGGPETTPPTIDRWVRNVAGGNNAYSADNLAAYLVEAHFDAKQAAGLDADVLFGAGIHTAADHFKQEAAEAVAYSDTWCVISD